MTEWSIRASDLKRYPHLDPAITPQEAMSYARNPEAVATHAFFPFLLYQQRWTRFAVKGMRGASKERPIRYAARRDAYIYAYYRHILSNNYERLLTELALDDCVLAYRRIKIDGGAGGKCNIHFSKDAFDAIRSLGDCAVIALDISGFFESLDHERLKSLWCRIMGFERLPEDHYNVFKSVTRYCCIDKKELFEKLGHFGEKSVGSGGKPIKGYLTPHNKIPRHLCRGHEFRKIVAGGSGKKSVLQTNYKRYGIPQGAPISDLLANLYLIDFDTKMNAAARAAGGHYYRYSDDILIIVPGNADAGKHWMAFARNEITSHGQKLIIKEEKASICTFRLAHNGQSFERIHGSQCADGLEYLGFRFNGRRVYLRNSTISGLYRKVARAARRDANALVRRYPNKAAAELLTLFDYDRLISRFGRVENFGENADDYRNWTFWTYAKRAADVFGSNGKSILGQLAKSKSHIRARAQKEVIRAVILREKRAARAAA